MKSTLMTRMALGMVAGGAVLSSFAVSASAAPSKTPAGYIGACNMLVSGPGMVNAMKAANPSGDAGMWGAVYASQCAP